MREEYDLAKMKVKRRGPLPVFRDAAGRPLKVRIWRRCSRIPTSCEP